MAIPVVIAKNGLGMPVRAVSGNAPGMVVAENGLGMPIVISDNGVPFVVDGLWSPLDLFAEGQPGHWPGGYNPSRGTIWQNAEGNTAATANGQPVGLVLDISAWAGKSLPEVMAAQSEVVAQPLNFTVSPYSIATPAATLGTNTITTSSNATGMFWDGLTNRSPRMVTVQFSDFADSTFGIYDVTSGRALATSNAASGALTTMYVPNSGSNNGRLYFRLVSPGSVTIDAFSVKVIPGAPASQTTVLSRPTLTLSDGIWHVYDDGGDSLPVILPAGTYGVAYIDSDGEITFDTATDPTDSLFAERQVDVIIRQGDFTDDEKAAIAAYWARYQ